MTPCPVCERPFQPGKKGAHPRKFCSDRCRAEFHKALRLWAENRMALGLLSMETLMGFARRIRQEEQS